MSESSRFQESQTAQQLADALRDGHGARRRDQPDSDELSAHLRRLADLESIPAVAKPGLTAVPMKLARGVLRVLLRPWLAVQTQANHEIARQLQRVDSGLSDLARRTPQLEQSLQHVAQRLAAVEGAATAASRADRGPTLDDFQRASDRVPLLADLKPSGTYVQEDLHAVGGTPAVMKYLLERGFLHGDCMTVTGKTLAENLAEAPPLSAGQQIIQTVEQPVPPRRHIRILRGNLAPDGAVAKITGKEGERFAGPAPVDASE
jgi:hypothetical protein